MGRYELVTKYSGVVPAGKGTGAVPVFKTGVNSRMSLSDRVAALQCESDKEADRVAADPQLLKAKLDSIDANPQTVALQRRHADGGSIQQSSITSTIRSARDVPERGHMWKAPGDGELQNIPMAHCKTVQQTAADGYVRNQDHEFLSRVRKMEKDDDDERAAQVKGQARADEKTNLRSAAVVHKRETDIRFAPPPMEFLQVKRAVPNAVRANASDSVKFTHVTLPSHYSLEFQEPNARLAECKQNHDDRLADMGLLANELALGSVSGCVDLQSGSAKDFDHIVSTGYGGHAPSHARNIAKVNGPEKEVLRTYSKSPLGLSDAAHKRRRELSEKQKLQGKLDDTADEALRQVKETAARGKTVTSASLRHSQLLRGI
jgi:hypothetical protein